MRLKTFFATVLVLAAAHLAAAADIERSLEAAMGPYYAALVASARGNLDASERQLLLLASRWHVVERNAAGAPPALANDPGWTAAVRTVTATIDRARGHLKQKDVASAHAELESIRHALHDVTERHNLLALDVHLTDFHEAIERLSGHVAGRNEIVLKAKDYEDLSEDLRTAETEWKAIEAAAAKLRSDARWRAAATTVTNALRNVDRAIAAKQAEEVARANESLKNGYFDLLIALSRTS